MAQRANKGQVENMPWGDVNKKTFRDEFPFVSLTSGLKFLPLIRREKEDDGEETD